MTTSCPSKLFSIWAEKPFLFFRMSCGQSKFLSIITLVWQLEKVAKDVSRKRCENFQFRPAIYCHLLRISLFSQNAQQPWVWEIVQIRRIFMWVCILKLWVQISQINSFLWPWVWLWPWVQFCGKCWNDRGKWLNHNSSNRACSWWKMANNSRLTGAASYGEPSGKVNNGYNQYLIFFLN